MNSKVKNVVFLVVSSGISYGGITTYCNMYYDQYGADINFYFIYFEADYAKGLRNTISFKDEKRIQDLFDNVLSPENTIIISTRIGQFNQFFRSYPGITVKFPVIVEHHANMLDYLNESKWLKGHFFPEHTRMNAINAIKVFTRTEAFEVKKYYTGKVLSIPNPSLSNVEQVNYNPNKVVFVARLEESTKNLTMLTQVAKQLKIKNKDIVIHIYGDGPDRKIVEPIADIAMIHGRVEDKHEIYHDACVVISTSNREGFGLTILEGAAYGIPAVSTKHCPAVDDLISHNQSGYLIDSDKIDEFVDAINELCVNKDLRQSFSQQATNISLNYKKEIVMGNYLKEMDICLEENLSLDKAKSMELTLNYFAKCYSYKLDENETLKKKIRS